MEKKKKQTHPWRVPNPLSPPKSKNLPPREARMGVKA